MKRLPAQATLLAISFATVIDTCKASAPHPAWAEPLIRSARKGGPVFVGSVLLLIATLLVAVGLLFLFLHITVARAPSTTSRTSLGRSVAVVVLGDVGRSPRMCLHAQSLAEDGWRVAVVGYKGTTLPPPLQRSSVKAHHLSNPFTPIIDHLPRTGGLFGLVAAPLKLIGQSGSLFWTLATQVKPPPELIVVQTPPALPALFIVRLVALLLGTRVIIDWHNLGYSILAMRFPPQSPFVKVYRLLERFTGGRAFAHLCVTRALKQHLEQSWRVSGPVKVLYDRPPSHFRRATTTEAHDLYADLLPSLSPSIDSWLPDIEAKGTSFTRVEGDRRPMLRNDRPALVVSSTSWTEDEDFSMLLRAASLYEERARELQAHFNGFHDQLNAPTPTIGTPNLLDSPMLGADDEYAKRLSLGLNDYARKHKLRRASSSLEELPRAKRLPKMLIIVTGKGELRNHYLKEIERIERQEKWQWVRIRTAWLRSEDYPTLLGAADVGVSLHSSSSGMDLPMKVVDMLGCGLPVCALGFPCINELVRHGSNGLVFYSEKELAIQLESVLARFPGPSWLSARTAPMKTMFPEDLVDSPPLSAPPSPAITDSPTQRHARPSSPIPMFTLLQSPALRAPDGFHDLASEDLGSCDESKARTWSRNWKRVVRPLLAEADQRDADQERRAKFAHLGSPRRPSIAFTSALRANPKSRNSQDEGDTAHAGLAIVDETGSRIDSSGGTIFARRHRRSLGAIDGRNAYVANDSSQDSSYSRADSEPDVFGRSSEVRKQRSRGHLRQRTNKDTREWPDKIREDENHHNANVDADASYTSTIPGIEISAPPT